MVIFSLFVTSPFARLQRLIYLNALASHFLLSNSESMSRATASSNKSLDGFLVAHTIVKNNRFGSPTRQTYGHTHTATNRHTHTHTHTHTQRKRSIPYDILHWFPASGWTRNFCLDYVELPWISFYNFNHNVKEAILFLKQVVTLNEI